MKKLLLCLLILLMCAHVALAQPTLDASMSDGLMAIHWTGCTCQQATLTLYRDGWPVLVACVCGADGSYDVPIWYTQEAGSYAVQLRCAEGCVRADAGNVNTPPTDASPEPTEVSNTTSPTATPMPRPTEKPGTVPTVRPRGPTSRAGRRSHPPNQYGAHIARPWDAARGCRAEPRRRCARPRIG